jgi:predicted secreted Zn-dependent protease
VNAHAAVLFAASLLSSSDEEVVQRVHARIVAENVVVQSCADVQSRDPEPGLATINFGYVIDGARTSTTRYAGRVTFALGEVTIRVPKSIAWKGMTRADRERADAFVRAIYHHEVGHVRVAEMVRDALNASGAISAPDYFAFGAQADAFGREGFARFKHDEATYDELTDHGRRQHLAPGELAGADTVLYCR